MGGLRYILRYLVFLIYQIFQDIDCYIESYYNFVSFNYGNLFKIVPDGQDRRTCDGWCYGLALLFLHWTGKELQEEPLVEQRHLV